MGYSVIVSIAPCEHLHWIPCNLFSCNQKMAIVIVPCEQTLSLCSWHCACIPWSLLSFSVVLNRMWPSINDTPVADAYSNSMSANAFAMPQTDVFGTLSAFMLSDYRDLRTTDAIRTHMLSVNDLGSNDSFKLNQTGAGARTNFLPCGNVHIHLLQDLDRYKKTYFSAILSLCVSFCLCWSSIWGSGIH